MFADPRDGGNQPGESQDGRQKHGDFHAKGASMLISQCPDVYDDDHSWKHQMLKSFYLGDDPTLHCDVYGTDGECEENHRDIWKQHPSTAGEVNPCFWIGGNQPCLPGNGGR